MNITPIFNQINTNFLFNNYNFLLTKRGWVEISDLKNGDKIIALKGTTDLIKPNKTV